MLGSGVAFTGVVYVPTCSQDVSCHPEGGQSADHGTSPQSGHKLREVGEDDGDRAADPTEGRQPRRNLVSFDETGSQQMLQYDLSELHTSFSVWLSAK